MSQPNWRKAYAQIGAKKEPQLVKRDGDVGSQEPNTVSDPTTESIKPNQKSKSFVNARCSLERLLDSQQRTQKDRDLEFCGIVVRKDGTRARRYKATRTGRYKRNKKKQTTSPLLSSEDELIAAPYRKMLIAGVPGGGVRQKLLHDGVPKRVIDAVIKSYIRHDGVRVRIIKRKVVKRNPQRPRLEGFLQGSTTTTNGNPRKENLVRPVMIKRNKPFIRPDGEKVIRVKKFLTKVQRYQWPTLLKGYTTDMEQKDIVASYMKLVGILPLGAVKQKMALDGVSREIIQMVVINARANEIAESMRSRRAQNGGRGGLLRAIAGGRGYGGPPTDRDRPKIQKPAWAIRMELNAKPGKQGVVVPVFTSKTKAGDGTEFYNKLLSMGMSAEDARVQMTIEGVAPATRDAIAPAPASDGRTKSIRLPRNQFEVSGTRGRGVRCAGGRGVLLREIAASRGRGPSPKREDPARLERSAGKDGFDEGILMQKMQEIQDRQKRCLALLDKFQPGKGRGQRAAVAPSSGQVRGVEF